MKTKKNHQQHCIPFEQALEKMQVLNQRGMLVKYYRVTVVSPDGGKVTLTFDPVKFHKKQQPA